MNDNTHTLHLLRWTIFVAGTCITHTHTHTHTQTNKKQKVLVTLGFTLSQATKALRESRGIALLYFRPLH